ncbi:MAG: hypothetical protein ACH34X_11240 [Thiolinea sp.]
MILKMIQMVLMMFGLVGWMVVGAVAMVLAPFVIGMLLIGAVIFAPDMEGY